MFGFERPKNVRKSPKLAPPETDFDVGFASGIEEDAPAMDEGPHEAEWTPREIQRIKQLFAPWSRVLLSEPARVASAFQRALDEVRPGMPPDAAKAIRWSFVRMRDDIENGVEPKEAIRPATAAEILERVNRHLPPSA